MSLMAEYGKNLPMLFTEIQWTTAVVTNGWDMDQELNDQWIAAALVPVGVGGAPVKPDDVVCGRASAEAKLRVSLDQVGL